MKQLKATIGILGVSSFCITLVLCYWYKFTSHPRLRILTTSTEDQSLALIAPMRHVSLDEVYKDLPINNSFELDDSKPGFLIDTPGCQIPLTLINYQKFLKKPKNVNSCGNRAIFLKKLGSDKVKVYIKLKIIKKYLKDATVFDCCYRFIRMSSYSDYETNKIKYTSCFKLVDGITITLATDFINVKCFVYGKQNRSRTFYDDVYAFTKKLNISISNHKNCSQSKKYNVLMLGMDSMSSTRFFLRMPRTSKFLMENFWLRFYGYHKVGDNTIPNLMAAFTGKTFSKLSKKCAGRLDKCNDLLIWSKFKRNGYVTAYGEDYLRLPDTFSRDYAFRKPPTDHYMRPLFLNRETEFNKSLVCTGKVPSAQQILDYALDFAVTYREQPFFGVFWVNSFTHNAHDCPQNVDKMFENFFNQLMYTGVQDNTFVILFSDHGIRFGEHRLQMESYYDERLPMLYVSIPRTFMSRYPVEIETTMFNQFRLITPYDLFNTLEDINRISSCERLLSNYAEGCPNCRSLFDVISANRTCDDVTIHDKWCTCHKLFPLDIRDTEGVKGALVAVSHIKSLANSIQTKRCWGCLPLSLKSIIRTHFYYDKDKMKLYYVAAFSMSPGNMSYEATILRKGENFELIGPVSVISPYRGLGKCTINPKDRVFCVCKKKSKC